MPLKNLLSLHEAIVVALISQASRTASFEEIAKFIAQRNLYPVRKGKISLAKQVMLRSTKAKGAYRHLFEEIGASYIRLRDTSVSFPMQMSEAFDAVLDHSYELFHPPAKTFKVVDVELESNRTIKISAENVVCILTLEINNRKTGRKKFIYLKEKEPDGKEIIGIYSIHESLLKLYTQIDPLCNYLAIVSDNTLVNVGYYKISKNKILKPLLKDKTITSLPAIKFSESKAAKIYQEKFELIQRYHINRISLQKKILGIKSDMGLK